MTAGNQQASSSMACHAGENAEGERVFDFFGLPQEMRDGIYKELGVEIVVRQELDEDQPADGDDDQPADGGEKAKPHIEALVTNAPMTKLLGLSKQFKSEYLKCLKDHRLLTFRDLGTDWGPVHKLHPNVCAIPKVAVELMCGDQCECGDEESSCEQMNDMREHGEWVCEVLGRLDQLLSLTIRLSLNTYESKPTKSTALAHGSALKTELDQMPDSSKLNRIEVYFFEKNYTTSQEWWQCAYTHRGNVQAAWTKEDGWTSY